MFFELSLGYFHPYFPMISTRRGTSDLNLSISPFSTSSVEKTRCSGCDNAVIDDRKKTIWQGIYKQQIELKEISDIGPAGKARIVRDIERCEHVLKELGINPCGIRKI
jgi:hypothetical protein